MSREKIEIHKIPTRINIERDQASLDVAWDRAIAVNKIVGMDNLIRIVGPTAREINNRLKEGQNVIHDSDRYRSIAFRVEIAETELDGAIERSTRSHKAAETRKQNRDAKLQNQATVDAATETELKAEVKVITREERTPDQSLVNMRAILEEQKWIARQPERQIIKSTIEYNGGDVDPEMRFVDSKSTDVVPVIVESKPIKLEENIETVPHTTQIDRITQETGPDLKTLPEKFNGLVDPEKIVTGDRGADLTAEELVEALKKAWDRMAPTDIHDEDIFGSLGNKLSIIFTDLKNKWQNWVNNKQVSKPVNSADGQINVLKTEIIAVAETGTELTENDIKLADIKKRRGENWTPVIPATSETKVAEVRNGWTGPRLNGVDRDNYIAALMTTVADRDAKLKARDERRGQNPLWIAPVLTDEITVIPTNEVQVAFLAPAMDAEERKLKRKLIEAKRKLNGGWEVDMVNDNEFPIAPQNDYQKAFLAPRKSKEERDADLKRINEKRKGQAGGNLFGNNLATN